MKWRCQCAEKERWKRPIMIYDTKTNLEAAGSVSQDCLFRVSLALDMCEIWGELMIKIQNEIVKMKAHVVLTFN